MKYSFSYLLYGIFIGCLYTNCSGTSSAEKTEVASTDKTTDMQNKTQNIAQNTFNTKASLEVPEEEKIIVNNKVWNGEDIAAFTKIYGMPPKPGNYWYDTRSGLYGLQGNSSWGFLYPGHQYGTLSQNASSGKTGVLINGRELPTTEWNFLNQICGVVVQPGRYWMDSYANAGPENDPYLVYNLIELARRNGYGGSSNGGGDNFWSSRVGAGNSSGGSGYVSVPGYGPVGYGNY